MAATRLFVGNIGDSTQSDDLAAEFSNFGEILNVDLKTKPNAQDKSGKFAFITLSADQYSIEKCIKHYTHNKLKDNQVYVTRARESFLERLQREREESKRAAETAAWPKLAKTDPKLNLNFEALNPRKRQIIEKIKNTEGLRRSTYQRNGLQNNDENFETIYKKGKFKSQFDSTAENTQNVEQIDTRKKDSEMKRLESIKKMRQTFNEKKLAIKCGLAGVDKPTNKKVRFSDSEEMAMDTSAPLAEALNGTSKGLFDDDDSDEELDFKIKEQFEGKKGQKVLELQTRYKNDKRFTLDKRFVEEDSSGDEKEELTEDVKERVKEVNERIEEDEDRVEDVVENETDKQLSILENVLGVTLKSRIRHNEQDQKKKPKLGMPRFDPSQPDHAKFLAPAIPVDKTDKKKPKSKKDKDQKEVSVEEKEPEPKVEVSQEKFYKVSDSLKETIAQPNSFSLRSLFGSTAENQKEDKEDQNADYIPISLGRQAKNPLDRTNANPFKYDSSDSEEEAEVKKAASAERPAEDAPKAVWKENFFFAINDIRLKEGVQFFSKPAELSSKDRRELRAVVRRRIQNQSRKQGQFARKIGGKRRGPHRGGSRGPRGRGPR